MNKYHEHGQGKRKLSDTSFASSNHCSDVSSSTSKVMINSPFTLGSPYKQLPDDLSVVLPKPKLSPDKHGVVKFGAYVKPPASGSKPKNTFLKPPTVSLYLVKCLYIYKIYYTYM